MITGAHSIIYSRDAEADRAFLRDVLGLSGIDVGGGWLIFGLPPAELAVHPADANDVHEFYFITDDVRHLVARLRKRGVACARVQDRGWGLLTQVTLPGGGRLGIYEPRHARPIDPQKPPKTRSAEPAEPTKHSGDPQKAPKTARSSRGPRSPQPKARSAPKPKA